MFDFPLLMAVFGSIGLLLFFDIAVTFTRFFISILIASIALGVFADIPANEVIAALQNGIEL